MKVLTFLFITIILFNIKIQGQTEKKDDKPVYIGLGASVILVDIDKNNFNLVGFKVGAGWEGLFPISFQYQGAERYKFGGMGVGYRPLAKVMTRFQPMIYCHLGYTKFKSIHNDTVISYSYLSNGNGFSTTDITQSELEYSFYTIIPEISLDYFFTGRIALSIFLNKSFIIPNNPFIEYNNEIREYKGNTSFGFILKLFLF